LVTANDLVPAVEAARLSHRALVNSTLWQWNQWVAYVNDRKELGRWQGETFGRGNASLLVHQAVIDEGVLAGGDRQCSAVYPLVWVMGADGPPAVEGAKVKISGGLVPTVAVMLEDTLVLAHWLGEGSMIECIPKAHVRRTAQVTMKVDFINTLPGIQYALESDGESDTLTFITPKLYHKADKSMFLSKLRIDS